MKLFDKTIRSIIFIGLLILPALAAADSEVYVRIDKHGVYHFTDTPNYSQHVRAPMISNPGSEPEAGEKYENIIRKISKKSGLRPELIKAVIRVESGFNPRAVSPKGASGLMQLMPVQTKRYKIQNPFDPKENIKAGSLYLGRLLERYNGNLNLSLAAYNAGPSAVDQYRGIPPYRETRQYVQKVLVYYRHYRNTSR